MDKFPIQPCCNVTELEENIARFGFAVYDTKESIYTSGCMVIEPGRRRGRRTSGKRQTRRKERRFKRKTENMADVFIVNDDLHRKRGQNQSDISDM